MSAAPAQDQDTVVRLYRQRSRALATGNRSAWESTVADPTSEAGRQQHVQYDNLRALGITELTVADVQPVPQPGGSWPGDSPLSADGEPQPQGSGAPSQATFVVRLGHRIPGFDRVPRFAERTVTLRPGRDGWAVVQDHSPADRLQVWDLPDLRVQRSDTALVAGNVAADVLARRLAEAEIGQARVRQVLGAPVPAVVVVPGSAQEAARQLGRETLGQVAASTDGSTGPPDADGSGPAGGNGADRVVLGPAAFAELTDQGRQVVLAHELAHVATRASLPGRVPLWLSEGLAEYVAWRPVGMPVPTAAAALRAQVRSGGAPATLPADSDFDPARADAATAYQAAWLAVRHLAQRHGDEQLLAFYRSVAAGSGAQLMRQVVQRAFVSELGTTFERFEQEWRAQLGQLAQ